MLCVTYVVMVRRKKDRKKSTVHVERERNVEEQQKETLFPCNAEDERVLPKSATYIST